MAIFDAHGAFAETTVATAPSPAISGTSLIVSAEFPLGALTPPFDIIVAPVGTRAIASNAEICTVTGKSGGGANLTWTISRARYGTTARTILVGDKVYLAISPGTFTDIEAWLPYAAVGDLAFASSASAASALAIGAAMRQLRVNAGATAPEWAGGLSVIADSGVLGSDQATIDFNSIPTTFSHLVLFYYARSSEALAMGDFLMRINNISTTTYDVQELFSLNATTAGGPQAVASSALLGAVPAATATANLFGSGVIFIPSYKDGSNRKNWITLSGGFDTETATTTNWQVEISLGKQRANTAITRLTFGAGTFGTTLIKAGSQITLCGVSI